MEIAADRVTEAVCSEPDGRPRPESRGHTTDTITLEVPAVLQRAGMAVRFVVPGAGDDARPDPSLMRLLVRAFGIRDRLDRNPDLSIQRIAEAEGVVASYATRLLRLSFLAPGIVAAILEGHQPPELTANQLIRDTRLPLEWTAQRRFWGSTSLRPSLSIPPPPCRRKAKPVPPKRARETMAPKAGAGAYRGVSVGIRGNIGCR